VRNPFHTRSAVITGASAGLGRAMADEPVRRRWRVALLARGRERLHDIGPAAIAAVDHHGEILSGRQRRGRHRDRRDRVIELAATVIRQNHTVGAVVARERRGRAARGCPR